ncbi:MAG: nuclear transport factor 2 family protein [Alphaproteobacteria bacterium]|nr:nuclear transport factor 2 family protein [Alphaproteobacteria bacterium]
MTINRRHLAAAGAAAALVAVAGSAAAAGADSAAVSKATEAFRQAMLKPDKATFEALCDDALTYGHSSGKVETKAEFIAASTNGKSSWKTLEFEKPVAWGEGGMGHSRFLLTGQTLSEGKTTDIKIGVLMVWVNRGGNWRLLARQAVKV